MGARAPRRPLLLEWLDDGNIYRKHPVHFDGKVHGFVSVPNNPMNLTDLLLRLRKTVTIWFAWRWSTSRMGSLLFLKIGAVGKLGCGASNLIESGCGLGDFYGI